MTPAGRSATASVVAAVTAAVPLVTLTEDRTYFLLALVLIVPGAIAGHLLRRAGVGEALIRLVQVLPVLLLPWLVPAAADPLELYADTYSFVQLSFAPMPYQAGFAVFCAVVVWLVYLLTETLTFGLASPAWTFPVLVLPYLIPALALFAETSPFLFCFSAAAYALVLATATSAGLPVPQGTDEAIAAGWRRAVAGTAALATALALAGALVFSLPIPERSRTGADPAGSGSVQLGDPSLDLIRNVNSNSDQVLVTYRTPDGSGTYLRLAALPVFDSAGFHLTATDLVPMPIGEDPPGIADAGTVRTSIQVGSLGSEYLPMPWFPVAADVDETWRYDPKTLAVVAIGPGRTGATRNLAYTAESARLPQAEDLLPSLPRAGDPGDDGQTLALPPEVSAEVRALAAQVAGNGDSAGAKALALAEFLRSEAFTYSLSAGSGTTLGTLNDFLLGSRTGYCEQFAGSMAVLARAIGIPSRVVVGFLPGRRVSDRWEVTARNMHAWTELYFADAGWVPVDATPSGAAGGPRPSASPSPSPTSAEPTPSTQPSATPSATVAPPPSDAAGGGPFGGWAWPVGGAALLLAAAIGPRLTRAALRAFRLAGSPDPHRAAERAWAEVRAATRDHGRDWPAGTSRQVAAALAPDLDADGRQALERLALGLERTRYDNRPVAEAGSLAGQARTVVESMERRWSRSRYWWPRSLWPQRG